MTPRLGRHTNSFSNGIVPGKQERYAYRLWLQDGIAELLADTDERVCKCLRQVAPAFGEGPVQEVKVMVSSSSNRARYSNLMLCGSVWSCPWCSHRISEERRARLAQAVAAAAEREYYVLMVTLTHRHQLGDDLGAMLTATNKAVALFRGGSTWQKMRREYGYRADIRALEVTYGANGYHPHHHILMIFESEAGFDREQFEDWAKTRWLKVLKKRGLEADYAHGLKVTDDYGRIAEYLAKYGKMPEQRPAHSGATFELTHSSSKDRLAGMGQRSMWQVAEDYTARVDRPGCSWRKSGQIFREYALTFKGRRQLEPSRSWGDGYPGFWELFGLEDWDKEDFLEFIDAPLDDEFELLGLSLVYWWLVVQMRARGKVLQIAADTKDAAAVWNFIESLVLGRAPPAVIYDDREITQLALYEFDPSLESFRDVKWDDDKSKIARRASFLAEMQNEIRYDLGPRMEKMINHRLRDAALEDEFDLYGYPDDAVELAQVGMWTGAA